jgi:DNA-binding CsgD family transcriptional regulator
MRKKRNLLNEKELKILKMISTGLTSNEVGEKMNFSVGTVDNYIKIMLLKTNTVNRAHLVYECAKQGII